MNVDLLHDRIGKSLILFSLPLIAGNLLQQLYNIVDTYIVGKCISSFALAAVSSSFSLMTFLTSIILGLCMGSGVLFSMYYGADRIRDMKKAIYVSFLSILCLSILIEVICLICIDPILNFLNIPETIFDMTHNYLWIVFFGIFFTFLYNFFASLLRAIGDSKTPLYFLAISTMINILLDLYFVLVLKLNVSGAAYATLIAQLFSGIGLTLYVLKYKRELLPQKEERYFDYEIFKKIQEYSLLTCMQQSVMNFGILMIQGLVNSFGLVVMSAFGAAVKIDAFAYMPVQDFGNGFSTFIAQNTGADNKLRVKQGVKTAFLLSGTFSLLISVIVFIFAKELMSIFINANETQIIQTGITYLHIEGACYIGIGFLFLLYGYYRGVGKPAMSLVLTVISLGTRVALSYALAHTFGTTIIWWSIPIGWFLADLTGIAYGILKDKWLNVTKM